ncbi:MAG: ATP-binding cassette domain-containing protein, partial [Kiloniellales bacterium]
MSEGSARASAGQQSVKLACEGVWKVFGPDAASYLAKRSHKVTYEQLAEAGLIGAVRDANLEVYEGEIFIIMGLSGSGKSTLVRCMSRLIESTAGKVVFDGQDLLAASEKEMIEIRRHK